MGFRVYLDLLVQTHLMYLYMIFVYATNDCHWKSEFINEPGPDFSRDQDRRELPNLRIRRGLAYEFEYLGM